ncbi:hypothetical protein K438DRAFT_1809947, partial [Mycena galopus ATCC 62051]
MQFIIIFSYLISRSHLISSHPASLTTRFEFQLEFASSQSPSSYDIWLFPPHRHGTDRQTPCTHTLLPSLSLPLHIDTGLADRQTCYLPSNTPTYPSAVRLDGHTHTHTHILASTFSHPFHSLAHPHPHPHGTHFRTVT